MLPVDSRGMLGTAAWALVALLHLSGATRTAAAGEGAGPDKSAYTLFNPTPREAMR